MRDFIQDLGDASYTAAQAFKGLARLAHERVTHPRDIPTRTNDLDAEWMTTALKSAFPGVRVRALVPLEEHGGTTHRVRFQVIYDESPAAVSGPSSVFVKLVPADSGARLFGNLFHLGAQEVRFYRELAPSLPVQVPRVYYTDLRGRTDRFVLLLEDLSARGARFPTVVPGVTLDEARTVIRELARLHASFWQSPRLSGDLAWALPNRARDSYPVSRLLTRLAAPAALRRAPDLVPSSLHAAARSLATKLDGLEAAWTRGPLTLIHGDTHAGNLYQLPDAVGFFDWQLVQRGQGTRDISYFLFLSLPTELRRAHERELLALYLSYLQEYGVAAPSEEEAWTQHRLHAIYAWLAALVTVAVATLQAETIARTALSRTSAAILDLDSLSLSR